MKYIKSFNEELKSTTYRSAGWKIRELGRNKSERNKKIYNDRSDYGIDFKDIYEFSRKMRADDLVH